MTDEFSADFRVADSVQLYDDKIPIEMQPTPSNVGDSIIVWFKSEKEAHIENYSEILAHLCAIADYFQAFTDIDSCIDFISTLTYEKVFLIVPVSGLKQFIPLIHNIPQVAYIYICGEIQEGKFSENLGCWIKEFPVVRSGVHRINNGLFNQLRNDVNFVRSCSVPCTHYSPVVTKNNSIKDLNENRAAYWWNRLLLNALRTFPQNTKSKQDIISECKILYADNKAELEKIENFEKTYHPHLAIWWYSKDSFLYKLLNKAFRTEDIDVVFKFRFFITDLYSQLTDLHNQSKSDYQHILTVYRGQQIATSELEVFKLQIDGYISMNAFLSTTTNKDVALLYAGTGSERPLRESVFFEMIIDANISDLPLANISEMSSIKDEDEVLLSMGMIFKINSVVELENNVWKVTMTSANETNIPMSDYQKYLQQDVMCHDDPLVRFGSLLFEMGLHDKEEKYYLMMLAEGTDKYGTVYNNLGLCYYTKRNYRRALHYYRKALNYYTVLGLAKTVAIVQVCNNIGLIYEVHGDYDRALQFYYEAFEIQLASPIRSDRKFLLTLTRLLSIHAKCGCYHDVIEKGFYALKIADDAALKNSPYAAAMYTTIGNIYGALAKYSESIKNLEIGLKIQQAMLPADHHSIATTYCNIGVVYDLMRDHDRALEFYQQARTILTKKGNIGRTVLATVYANIGVVHSKKGEYTSALDYQDKSLQIRAQFFPGDSESIAKIYSNIAAVYGNMHNTEKAIAFGQKAIDIIRRSQIPNNPYLGLLYNNLGLNYQSIGNDERALHYFNLSLEIKHTFFFTYSSIDCKDTWQYLCVAVETRRYQDGDILSEESIRNI